MRLEGIHHVTCITGDAPGNVDFYTGVLGLRLVKKTVNQDDPTVYHLFYADEEGSPGADITFFEYPGARRGRAGAGMVHTITFRVASEEALDFWEARLGGEGDRDPPRRRAASASRTRRGSGSSCGGRDAGRAARRPAPRDPGRARAAGLRQRARLRRRRRTRAGRCSRARSASRPSGTSAWEARGAVRGGLYAYDPPPASGSGIPGAGTVHHVAWASNMDEQEAWLDAVLAARSARERDHRPLLVPLDLLPRAERRPLRDRDARARASRSTRTRSTSARRSSCRPPSSTCAPGSSRC